MEEMIDLTVERLGLHGEGIAKLDGYTVFVDGGLPGELVKAHIFERKKQYAKARLIEVLKQSEFRVNPVCPLFGTCGGCQVMHLSYDEQLIMKRQRVVDALERIGKIENATVEACLPSQDPLHYRNKTQLAVRPGLKVGFNAKGSHDLVDIEKCYIHSKLGEKVYEILLPLIKHSNFTAFDWKSRKGFLRHLIIKTAINNDEALVVFVTNGENESLKGIAQAVMQQCPEVKGVIQNINNRTDNIVLGKKNRVVAGVERIKENLCGFQFNLSASSFFQVNTKQAEYLYQTVINFAELNEDDTLLDLFCGVGTMGIIAAPRVKEVIGVESVQDAIDDAKENAMLNNIKNINFICNRVETCIEKMKRFDVAIINPPRKGCERSVLEELGKRKPERLVYVSCDPATLARDLAIFKEFGYKK